MVNQQKILKVEKTSKLLQKTKNFVLIKFDSTPHQALENLRRQLKKNQAKLSVVKNTLFEKAVNKLSSSNKFLLVIQKFFPLKETSALITFTGEWHQAISAFYKFAQEQKTLSFKFALIDNQPYEKPELERIAQLPAKGKLIAKAIGSIKSPLIRLNYGLRYNMMKLVYILKNPKS